MMMPNVRSRSQLASSGMAAMMEFRWITQKMRNNGANSFIQFIYLSKRSSNGIIAEFDPKMRRWEKIWFSINEVLSFVRWIYLIFLNSTFRYKLDASNGMEFIWNFRRFNERRSWFIETAHNPRAKFATVHGRERSIREYGNLKFSSCLKCLGPCNTRCILAEQMYLFKSLFLPLRVDCFIRTERIINGIQSAMRSSYFIIFRDAYRHSESRL